MVRTRVVMGLSLLAGFLLLAWLDSRLSGGPLFHVFIGAVVVCGLLEFYALAERQDYRPLKTLAVALVAALVALDYALRVERGGALARWLPDYSTTLLGFYAVIGLATTVVFGVLAVAHLVGRDPQRTLPDLSVTMLGVLYVWILGMHVLAIRGLGMAYVLIFLAAAKLGDAGAYFCGMRFGRHALAPRTSPKKTAEGAVGGLLASAVAGVLVAKAFAVNGSLGYWAGFSLAVAVAAQVGDLLESALKRSVGAKDSGGFLPTFGGILDLIDSPLLSAPVALWILAWAPPA